MERRRSRTSSSGQDGHPRPRSDVFGDEYEIVDIGPADGYRHDSDQASIRSFTPSEPYSFTSSSRIQTTSAHLASDPSMTIAPYLSRNSTRKSTSQNPFASIEDDSNDIDTSLARSPSILSSNFAPGLARRSVSSASSRQYAGMSTAGPSHPYTMYPQGTMVRTASTATSAAAGRAGPAHPYGMYTQGVTHSDDEDEEEDASNPVPVGFGLGQTYRRVRGPEGEEQDIIGEYGHAEQLPPYSRYAEDGPTKMPIITEPEPLHSRSPIEGTDPSMPLMLERMTHRQSMTDASQLESDAPLLGETASSTETSTLGKPSWKEKSWDEKKRTRICCGIQFKYCLILLGAVAFIFAALIGSLVGYLAGSKRNKSGTLPAASSYYDASLIPTPSNSMPSGTFALALGTPQATQADCLVNAAQQPAWDCRLGGKPALAITVGLPAQAAPTPGARVFYAVGQTNLSYGAQYQAMDVPFSNFQAVRDNDNATLGPAFYFQQTFNKVVIVPEALLSPSNNKRGWGTPHTFDAPVQWNNDWRARKQQAQPGEKPWFCVFNNTLMEGYIYVSQAASLSTTTTATTKASSTMTTSMPSASSAWTTSAPGDAYSGRYDRAQITSDADVQGRSTSIPAQLSTMTTDRPQTTAPIGARDFMNKATDETAFYQLSGFPFVMKIEERRLPGNPVAAYCQQYQILDNEHANWLPDANGNPIKIMLEENDPPYTAYMAPGSSKRNAGSGACHCQWMHGVN